MAKGLTWQAADQLTPVEAMLPCCPMHRHHDMQGRAYQKLSLAASALISTTMLLRSAINPVFEDGLNHVCVQIDIINDKFVEARDEIEYAVEGMPRLVCCTRSVYWRCTLLLMCHEFSFFLICA